MVPKTKDPFDRFLDWLEDKVKRSGQRFASYIKRLLFPLYLFPIKLVTYSLYYVVRFIWIFIWSVVSLFFDVIRYPFRSMKHFLKSIVIAGIGVYLLLSVLVITDYLSRQYGYIGKFFCSYGAKQRVEDAVVRVEGGKSEGTGFYISPNQILTSFHVIDGEPSPKIILPDGKMVTPEKIVGDKTVDLAVLTIGSALSTSLHLPDEFEARPDEPMFAVGYALGTEMKGAPTVLNGNFVALRQSKKAPSSYVQTSINLVEGMSGGPLADQCGNVVGINTMGLAGLSLFVPAAQAKALIPKFTDQNVAKIDVDASKSPEEAVRAFYTYLKTRRMEDGFKLLSTEYLVKTNFTEWTHRFTDILDVEIIMVRPQEGIKDSAFVKFGTKNWVDNEVDIHYYEGTWQTVQEDGVYKMNKSNIKEITDPPWDWFYN